MQGPDHSCSNPRPARGAGGEKTAAKHLSDGSASMSTNPFVDYHLVYAVVLIALAVVSAGDAFGLGRLWARIPLVRDHGWLR
ncbi:hypothetical protein B7767_37605 [Streptomyces sp. 13-12-16]|nr:hypothetical protein B7767_37605 [Streptomyces sp. 13-12-16]